MDKKPFRRPAPYPEVCLAGPVGELQRLLLNLGEISDIHALAVRMHNLTQGWKFDENKTELFIQWSIHQWVKSNKPVFVMEEDLAWALTHTEPPMEKFDLLPEIPIEGMYITLPPVFNISSEGGGSQEQHKIEGVFLTRNEVLVPKVGTVSTGPISLLDPGDLSGYDVHPSITVVGVGEDKRPQSKNRNAYLRDDLVMFFSLVPGKPLYQHAQDNPGGLAELTRVVVNLLYLLQNTRELSEAQDPPLPESILGESRNARRERERQVQKGRSCLRHTVWKLSSLQKERRNQGEASGRHTAGHIVLGHVHRYWVVDPQERKVLKTKVEQTSKISNRTYHLVAKWVLPYRRGSGPAESPTVILR